MLAYDDFPSNSLFRALGRNQSRCSPGYSVVRPWFRSTYAPLRGVIIRLFFWSHLVTTGVNPGGLFRALDWQTWRAGRLMCRVSLYGIVPYRRFIKTGTLSGGSPGSPSAKGFPQGCNVCYKTNAHHLDDPWTNTDWLTLRRS